MGWRGRRLTQPSTCRTGRTSRARTERPLIVLSLPERARRPAAPWGRGLRPTIINAYPEQDSNLHCPRPERGASCQLGYPGVPAVDKTAQSACVSSAGFEPAPSAPSTPCLYRLGHEDQSCWEPRIRTWTSCFRGNHAAVTSAPIAARPASRHYLPPPCRHCCRWTRVATGSRTPVSAMARRRTDRCATATNPRCPLASAAESARRPCGVRTRNLSAENRASCRLAPTVRDGDRPRRACHVDLDGFEPSTSGLPNRCATRCATSPSRSGSGVGTGVSRPGRTANCRLPCPDHPANPRNGLPE